MPSNYIKGNEVKTMKKVREIPLTAIIEEIDGSEEYFDFETVGFSSSKDPAENYKLKSKPEIGDYAIGQKIVKWHGSLPETRLVPIGKIIRIVKPVRYKKGDQILIIENGELNCPDYPKSASTYKKQFDFIKIQFNQIGIEPVFIEQSENDEWE